MSTVVRTNETITVTEPGGDMEVQYREDGGIQVQIEAVALNDAATAVTAANAALAAQATLESTLTLARFTTYVASSPLAFEVLYRFIIVDTIVFDVNMAGSAAKAVTPATGTPTFSIEKNDVQFAVLNFNPGQADGVFASASQTTFVNGDVLKIIAPGTIDPSLADISLTLAGVRSV